MILLSLYGRRAKKINVLLLSRAIAQLVARFVRDEEVVGSNPTSPREKQKLFFFTSLGMKCLMHFFELLIGNMSINLRGGN